MLSKVRRTLLILFGMSALCATVSAPALAAGPYWRVNGSRLEVGKKGASVKGGGIIIKGKVIGLEAEVKCAAVKATNALLEGNGTMQGRGTSTLLLEGCIAAKPVKCAISKTIKTTKLDWRLTFTAIPFPPFIIVVLELYPQEGEIFTNLTFTNAGEAEKCPVAGTEFPIKGTVAGEVIPEGEEVKEVTVRFPETPITADKLEGKEQKVGLTLGASPATLAGKLAISLVSGEKFGAFQT